jgi:hypothetical protein
VKILAGLALLLLVAPARGQSGALTNYAVDIFYCQHSSVDVTQARRARANDALERVKKIKALVTARVRLLPTGTQSRPHYQGAKDEVRFAGKDKAAAAELARIIGVPAIAAPVEERTLYLSAFYCAG